jgi:hypothetical protein
MNKIILFIYVILSFVFGLFLVLTPSYSAPAPRQFAINEAKKQCGIYWGGDEFVAISLPEGWDVYDDVIATNEIATEYGNCSFENGDIQSCCTQLGFNYIPENELPNILDYQKDPIKINEVEYFCVPYLDTSSADISIPSSWTSLNQLSRATWYFGCPSIIFNAMGALAVQEACPSSGYLSAEGFISTWWEEEIQQFDFLAFLLIFGQ